MGEEAGGMSVQQEVATCGFYSGKGVGAVCTRDGKGRDAQQRAITTPPDLGIRCVEPSWEPR